MICGKRVVVGSGRILAHQEPKKHLRRELDVDKIARDMLLSHSSHLIPPIDQLCKNFLACLITGEPFKEPGNESMIEGTCFEHAVVKDTAREEPKSSSESDSSDGE